MNIAVKFYKDHPAKDPLIPDNRPWTCREIGQATSYSKEPGIWTVMSVSEYQAIEAQTAPLMKAYHDKLDALAPKPPLSLEERVAALEAKASPLKTLMSKFTLAAEA